MSGGYLGEIVRRVLLRMSEESALFGDALPQKLTIPYILWYIYCILYSLHFSNYSQVQTILRIFQASFRSPDMAAMHQDISEEREIVNRKLKEVFGVSFIETHLHFKL